jgi:phospholipid/cholesterol/gamma-HCH transport system permease protein
LRRFLAVVGESTLASVRDIGGVALLAGAAFRKIIRPPFEWRATVLEFRKIGYESMGVVALLGLFTGMVLVVQTGFTLRRFGAEMYVSEMVALAVVRELGPVLVGFLVAGRVGSGIAAEIGAMSTSEQIDAMRSLGADPVRKLVVPKAVASIIGLPLLTAVADLIGILGGMVMGATMLNIQPSNFLSRVQDQLTVGDFASGVIKTAFFGGIIAIVACYFGFETTGGTVGVGRSATRSVVLSCVLILVADLVLTSALFAVGGIVSV